MPAGVNLAAVPSDMRQTAYHTEPAVAETMPSEQTELWMQRAEVLRMIWRGWSELCCMGCGACTRQGWSMLM